MKYSEMEQLNITDQEKRKIFASEVVKAIDEGKLSADKIWFYHEGTDHIYACAVGCPLAYVNDFTPQDDRREHGFALPLVGIPIEDEDKFSEYFENKTELRMTDYKNRTPRLRRIYSKMAKTGNLPYIRKAKQNE